MQHTISIRIKGKVQGVYYRQSTKEKALELNITGYVKNMNDDDVFVIATGNDEDLKKLAEWCKKGPARAFVTKVIVTSEPVQEFTTFSIQRNS
jgi:acylphosphatase